MVKSNTSSPFFSYVFCMVAYFLSVFANEFFIKEFMHLSDISFKEYDQIIYFKILGRITAAVILLLFVKVFSFKKIIVFNIFLYFLSVFNIIFVDTSHEITLLCFFIYTSTTIVVSTLLLGYILVDNKINDNYSISVYLVSILLAYLIVDTFEYFIIGSLYYTSELMILNILSMVVFLLMLFLSPAYGQKINLDKYRFFEVIKRMEIEILVGFSIFYMVMVVESGYEIYALADSLLIFSNAKNEYVGLCSVAASAIIVTIYIPRFNKHKVSIACIITLILIFVSLPEWGSYFLLSILGRVIFIFLIYTLFACNLLIIVEKFRNINLFSALSIYSLGAVFGYYCGYVTINTSENTLGPNGFLISICFVLLGLLFYYSYLFKKHKLYR